MSSGIGSLFINQLVLIFLQAFFQRWWLEQSVEVQERVKKLVEAGQLEFV